MKKIFYGLMVLSTFLVSCDKVKDTTREPFQGEDITGSAEIQMDKNTKVAYLDIDTKGTWILFSGSSKDSIDFVTPLLTATGSGRYKLDVPGNRRTYYFLETDEGTALLAERQLPMAGGFNFRDLGGIRNKDGKYTQWGKIFRSDDMHNLTDEDLTYLASIPIVSVVDFRSGQEMQDAPDVLPASVKNGYAYSIVPGNLTVNMDSIGNIQATQLDSMMMQMNISFVTDSAYYNRYKDFFALLMDDSKVPLMFHCTAGKDRTGMAAALILSALNVDESVIMADYLSSNKYLEDKYKDIKKEYPVLESLFGVKPEFLQAGLDQIKKDHGSVENFLRNVLEVDIAKFQAKYLY